MRGHTRPHFRLKRDFYTSTNSSDLILKQTCHVFRTAKPHHHPSSPLGLSLPPESPWPSPFDGLSAPPPPEEPSEPPPPEGPSEPPPPEEPSEPPPQEGLSDPPPLALPESEPPPPAELSPPHLRASIWPLWLMSGQISVVWVKKGMKCRGGHTDRCPRARTGSGSCHDQSGDEGDDGE